MVSAKSPQIIPLGAELTMVFGTKM